MKHEFRTIQGYPCPKLIAPYFAIVVDDAHATVQSIYRGDDARAILNAHGHHSQYQLVHATAAQRVEWGILGTPNPVGESTHEQKSDGRAYPVPVGRDLAWWQVGIDILDQDVDRVKAAAARYGWHLFQPYAGGTEHHHLNFAFQPHPTPRTALRILRLRRSLPRR